MALKTAPYGTWESGLTPELAAGKLRFLDVQYAGTDLVWLEGRGRKAALMLRREMQPPVELPAELDPRGGLAYGGGDFSVTENLLFCANRNGRISCLELATGKMDYITPQFGAIASPAGAPDGRYVLFLHTDNRDDSIGLVDRSSGNWPVRLVRGADFYMQPVWHPAGRSISWVEWDAPEMPWDGSRIMQADFDDITARISNIRTIAGNRQVPVFQPLFSPDGKYLSFIRGCGDRDELVLYDLASGQITTPVSDLNLIPPAWVMGMRVYGWAGDSRTVYLICQENGESAVLELDIPSGRTTRLDLSPYTSFSQITVSSRSGRFACIAASPWMQTRGIEWDQGKITTVCENTSGEPDEKEIPEPQPVSWNTSGGDEVHGLYYAPKNSKFTGSGLPPAIIHVHGGPTGSVERSFSFEMAFFTNRGYAVLAVNYRGSTGYGRRYQQALNGHWGEYDVEDTVSGAKFLVENQLADSHRLILKGSSAGGYTVLNTLIRHPGVFAAAICSYPVANLLTILQETFKFEQHYYDSLIGRYPEEAEKYEAWSPARHIDRLTTPMLLFHGDSDPVVPVGQSDEICAALRARGVPLVYHVFNGEGHGWKKPETLETYYAMIQQFLQDTVVRVEE